MQRHAGRGGDALPLVDEVVDEMAELGAAVLRREVPIVRQAGECRDGVDGRVEDQLRPLRRSQIRKRLRLQA